MSDIDSRPVASRGRSSTRGARASHPRGPPRQTQTSSTANSSSVQFDDAFDEQGELGNMKKTYSTQLSFMRDMFPDWTDDDLVFAIAEADGDVQIVIDRITQGALLPVMLCKPTLLTITTPQATSRSSPKFPRRARIEPVPRPRRSQPSPVQISLPTRFALLVEEVASKALEVLEVAAPIAAVEASEALAVAMPL
jgi:hypothetical protein